MSGLSDPIVCPGCGTEVARSMLACPACRHLIHAEQLKELGRKAAEAAGAGYTGAELALWRQVLDLLPPDTNQFRQVSEKVAGLSARMDGAAVEPGKTPPGSRGKGTKVAAGLGAIGLIAWKFKVLLILLLTKGKLLLLGLTKASTVFSMLLSFGVYWTAWGWKFALGLVLSIYVHEMGHVAMLRRYGIKASAPMFIPGVGALVLLGQHPATPAEDARTGLAGPMWGFGAAVAAYAVSQIMDWPSWAAIAKVGAWINLFNLLPIWQLDGGRAFNAFSRTQRWAAAAVIAGAWLVVKDGLLVLLLIAAVFRAFSPAAAGKADQLSFVEYVFLVVLLAWMCMIPVDLGTGNG